LPNLVMHPGTVHIAPPIHNHRPIDYSQSISNVKHNKSV